MTEEWKDIVGFEGMYQVSNLGNIKSLARKAYTTRGIHNLKEKPLKLFTCNDGHYNFVHFYKDGKHINRLVHRLVLITFAGPPPSPKMTCNHKNGIGTDNRLENLEWMTQSENNYHAYRVLGKVVIGCDPADSSTAKLTWAKVRRIRELRKQNPEYWLHRRLAEKFGVDTGTIGNLLRGATWIER